MTACLNGGRQKKTLGKRGVQEEEDMRRWGRGQVGCVCVLVKGAVKEKNGLFVCQPIIVLLVLLPRWTEGGGDLVWLFLDAVTPSSLNR